ncbi:Sodium-dependent phosphate transporter [Vibrio cholerae]|nr:Sodium-dependent phosphate transporter [Vibrio cholerae]
MVGRAREILPKCIGRGTTRYASGTVVTVLVQSSHHNQLNGSSRGFWRAESGEIYPFTLVRTLVLVSPLLAQPAVSGEFAVFASANCTGALKLQFDGHCFDLRYSFLRELPIKGAELISTWACKSKMVVVCYLLGVLS